MTDSSSLEGLDVLLRERPITLDEKKHYVRVCLGIAFYSNLGPSRRRLTGYTEAAKIAMSAIKSRDNLALARVRAKLDEADEHIINFTMHNEELPK